MQENSTIFITEELRRMGISPSPQRVAVLEFLRLNPVHPTAEIIFNELRQKIATLSLTTVYNTLKMFSQKGLVQQVIIEDGELRFDGNTNEHGHFKCTKCGQVIDLFPETGKSISINNINIPQGLQISERHFCLKGVCNNCYFSNEK